MHPVLMKAQKATQKAGGFNLLDVYGKARAARVNDKYHLLALLSTSTKLDTVQDMLGRYHRVEMDADEAEWVMAFVRAYTDIHEQMSAPPKFMADMAERLGLMDECDCGECDGENPEPKSTSNSMEVA